MRPQRTRGVRSVGAVLCPAALVLLLCACVPSPELSARVAATPSDPRATFVPGNVTTCDGAGFPGSIQIGSPSSGDASDANVSGTVSPNTGPIQPGQGEQVDITVTGAGVVVDAVVVKGGPASNLYSDPSVLAPALIAPQHYISPLNGGGKVPAISHWFACYHPGVPAPVGSLTVFKAAVVGGDPATPLPTGYSALVNCNDGDPAHQNVTVTLPGGGGIGMPVLTAIPIGTVCTVVEQDTGSLPPGTVVSYNPSAADTAGVTITATEGVEVTITNDFSALPPDVGALQVEKVLVPPGPGVSVPESFVVDVLCDDGTRSLVVVPGGGGPGSVGVNPTAGALCSLEELGRAALPSGWVVSHSVDDGQPTTGLPLATVGANGTVTVAVINDGTAVAPGAASAARPVAAVARFTG